MTLPRITLTALLAVALFGLRSSLAQMPGDSTGTSAQPSSTGFDPSSQAPADTQSSGTTAGGQSTTGAAGLQSTGVAVQAVPGGIPGTQKPIVFTTDRSILYPSVRDFQMSVGDSVIVRVFGEAEYTSSGRIDLHGSILLPYIGVVHLEGLTVPQGEELISSKLVAAGIYREPQVTIQVTEAPTAVANIVGEAHAVIPVFGQKRLIEVLNSIPGNAAGVNSGFPATASHIITIDRPGVPEPIVIDLGPDPATSPYANIPVFAGDTIIISRAGVVYVIGAFGRGGVFPLSGNNATTLMQLAALTGGPTTDARYDDLRLIRTVGDHRTLVKLDIKRVLNGKDPDPILEAGDILFLPTSTLKTILSSNLTSLIFSLASIALSVLAYSRD
jgi:polysaccharide export outer membrane protein